MITSATEVAEVRAASEKAGILIQQAAALSARVETALDAGDAEEVVDLLHARLHVLHRTESAIALLREAASSLGHIAEVRSLVADVVASATQLRSEEARLAIALEAERDRVGRELDQVEADEAVRSAYGKQTRERATINIVR